MKSRIFIIAAVMIFLLAGLSGKLLVENRKIVKEKQTLPVYSVSPTSTLYTILSPTLILPNKLTAIENVLDPSLTLECDFSPDTGGRIITQIKHGKVRATIYNGDNSKGEVLLMGTKMFLWFNNFPQGFMMDYTKITPPKTTGSIKNPYVNQFTPEMIQKHRASCHDAVINDDVFTLPSGITFVDNGSLLNQ